MEITAEIKISVFIFLIVTFAGLEKFKSLLSTFHLIRLLFEVILKKTEVKISRFQLRENCSKQRMLEA